MHDLARASLVGSVVLAGLVGAVACWQVAPDSAKDVLLEGGASGDSGDEVTFYDGPRGEGSAPGDDGGQVGDSAVEAEGQAPLVIPPTASPLLATGMGFGCSIDSSGAVWCWGDDTFGQAGSAPGGTVGLQLVQGVTGATWLALGDHHACAVTASHAVYCWGLNGSYQLGHAAATSGDLICPGAVAGETVPCTPTPTLVSGLAPAVAIAAAGAWTCIVATDGSVECWGGVQTTSATDAGVPCGQGTQATGGTCYPTPTPVAGVAGVTQLAVGYDHACAIVAAGGTTDAGNAVACWGKNNEAQVSPTACPGSSCATPLTRGDLPTTTSLVAGNAFTCVLSGDGTVRCFGDNTYGELGHAAGSSGDFGSPNADAGLGVYNPAPVPAAATTVASLVGGGNQATCALLPTGAVECWGGAAGSVGPSPAAVGGLPAIDALGTYDSTYVCGFAATDGTTWCWTMGGAGPAPVAPVADAGLDAGEAG